MDRNEMKVVLFGVVAALLFLLVVVFAHTNYQKTERCRIVIESGASDLVEEACLD